MLDILFLELCCHFSVLKGDEDDDDKMFFEKYYCDYLVGNKSLNLIWTLESKFIITAVLYLSFKHH